MQVTYFLSVECHREPANPSRRANPVPLTALAITSLSGPDRAKYLQGQVTCDVNALQPGQHTLGGHCDPKGKLWSDFRLLCLSDRLLMLTKPSVLTRQLPELKKFAIFAKVEISESHGQAVGVAGQGTDSWIAGQYGLQESGLIEGGMAVRVEADRWLLVSEQPLALTLPSGPESLWWGLEIKAGIPISRRFIRVSTSPDAQPAGAGRHQLHQGLLHGAGDGGPRQVSWCQQPRPVRAEWHRHYAGCQR